MKIEALMKAFGNIDHIYEGIKNNVFKKDHIEAVAKLRWNQCKICKNFDEDGKHCMVAGTQPCCKDCGCSLKLKLRCLSEACPIGRWDALMTEEAEEELKKSIGYEDEEG